MRETWHSFDLRTGARGIELKARTAAALSRIIGESTDGTVEVSCFDEDTQGVWAGWAAATLPGRTLLVAVDEDDSQRPIWAGFVLTRQAGPGQWVTCRCVTLEHYFDRRFTGTIAFDNTDQATIAGELVESVATDGITFTLDAPLSRTSRDLYVADEDDKTVLDVLTEMMDIDGGLDFTVDVEWADADRTALAYVARFRERLGSASAHPVVFELPGPVVDFTYTEDYGPEHGGNDVLAISSGQGSARPQSDHQVATELLANGWAKFERRYTPAENETRTSRLNAYARAELRRAKDGLNEVSFVLNLDEAPPVGVDWHLGDDVTLALTCPRFPARTDADGRQAPGFVTTMRVVGWEMDLDARTLTPRVWQED